MDQILQQFEAFDQTTRVSIVLAVVVVFLTIVVIWLARRSPSARKYVLLMGISNSGKTSIFTQLVYHKSMPTVTSIKENKRMSMVPKTNKSKTKQVEIVDIPGNDKIRGKFIEQYKRMAKSIIFVVDSANYHKEAKDIAQYLYNEILTDDVLSRFGNLRILIACNKQDLDLAKSKTAVQNHLEKEIELLRKISSSTLQSISDKSGTTTSSRKMRVKDASKSFEFKDLTTIRVDFCQCSNEHFCLVDNDNDKNTDNSDIINWLHLSS